MKFIASELKTIYRTKLDGVPVSDCCEADTELGYVVCHKRDETGKFMIDASGNNTVKEKFYGVVSMVDTGVSRWPVEPIEKKSTGFEFAPAKWARWLFTF